MAKKPVPAEKTQNSTIIIPAHSGIFVPFILVIPLHTPVVWRNEDSRQHSIRTTPDQKSYLNRKSFTFQLPVGQSITLQLDQPGLYHYYEPNEASWQEDFKRVKAKQGTAFYPLAMDGIIWVQGPVAGLPLIDVNGVDKGHDIFMNEFVAIQVQGAVAWHNFDEDAHFIGETEGWSEPVNPRDIGIYRIAGYKDMPGGLTTTIQFNQPGLYYYYCRNHDQINRDYGRASALPKASDYPIPMEGFVLVESA